MKNRLADCFHMEGSWLMGQARGTGRTRSHPQTPMPPVLPEHCLPSHLLRPPPLLWGPLHNAFLSSTTRFFICNTRWTQGKFSHIIFFHRLTNLLDSLTKYEKLKFSKAIWYNKQIDSSTSKYRPLGGDRVPGVQVSGLPCRCCSAARLWGSCSVEKDFYWSMAGLWFSLRI